MFFSKKTVIYRRAVSSDKGIFNTGRIYRAPEIATGNQAYWLLIMAQYSTRRIESAFYYVLFRGGRLKLLIEF